MVAAGGRAVCVLLGFDRCSFDCYWPAYNLAGQPTAGRRFSLWIPGVESSARREEKVGQILAAGRRARGCVGALLIPALDWERSSVEWWIE